MVLLLIWTIWTNIRYSLFSLNIYKAQLIRDHKLTEDTTSTSAHGATSSGGGEHGAASSSGSTEHGSSSSSGSTEHGSASSSGSTEHGSTSSGESTDHNAASSSGSAEHSSATSTTHDETSTMHSNPAATTPHSDSTAAEVLAELPEISAHHNAKRAILMVSDEYSKQQEHNYNPMEMTKILGERNTSQQAKVDTQPHWTVWCKYLAMTMISTTFQAISSDKESQDVDSSHHLMRRAEPEAAGGEFSENITMSENVFVYKIFLIFAGLILIINSMIKALNTKIAGKKFSLRR